METKFVFEKPRQIPPVQDVVNTSNNDQLCPFEFLDDTKEVIVDSEWWETEMTEEARNIAQGLMAAAGFSKNFQVRPVLRKPGISLAPDSTIKRREYFHLYSAHLHMFDAHHWLSAVAETNGAQIFDVPIRFIRLLRDLATIWCSGGNDNASLIEDIMDHPFWMKYVRPLLTSKKRFFVKLSTTSGKNDREIVPIQTERQLIEYLTHSKLMLQQYQWAASAWDDHPECDPASTPFEELPAELKLFPVKLIFQDWNDHIDRNCEFRVFVHKRRVVAMSQQSWSAQLTLPAPIDIIAKSIVDLYNNQLMERLPYISVVLDVFFDAQLGQARLIECNPWGAWNASGSALFNWIDDFNILYGDSDAVHVRTWTTN